MRIRLFALAALAIFIGWPWLSGELVAMMEGWAGYNLQFVVSKLVLCLALCLVGSLLGIWTRIGFVPARSARGWLSTLPLWAFILFMLATGGTFGAPGLNEMVLILLPIALLGSVSEEIVFRGGLWTALRPLGHWPVLLLTSAGFGAVHLQGLMTDIPDVLIHAQAFMAFSIGLIFAAMRIASGSIWPPLAGHAVFNWLSFSITGFGESAGPMPEGVSPDQVAIGLFIVSLVIATSGLVACWLAIRAEGKRDAVAIQKTSEAPA